MNNAFTDSFVILAVVFFMAAGLLVGAIDGRRDVAKKCHTQGRFQVDGATYVCAHVEESK